MIKNLNIKFPLKESYLPKHYILDATNQTLGRLSAIVSKLLRGKENFFYTPGVDLGNFVIILNASKIKISGKKKQQKNYYRESQRPGSLKKETFSDLNQRIPIKILEKSIWGMLPKGSLGRVFYRRLYIYSDELIDLKKDSSLKNKLMEYIFLKNT